MTFGRDLKKLVPVGNRYLMVDESIWIYNKIVFYAPTTQYFSEKIKKRFGL